ncbi:cytochrome c oxidase cbb3-type subunit 2 [Solimonas aquatica]|uniref:Cytochrome c oxidase cbb3-type subunit 2 n=1 Tax=Solimonas aquatica TaxID=489703 RepID=A0A1H8ZMA3_9GAMM|nr:cytochrome-c oxidase, cbb3-type subunit II [Solimonas aquatica]SEP65616.1 cytochrome c oxidase cbb3-type subunit 2 [Solimonas aquatica]
MKHETIEKNIGLMGILIAVAISFGGLVEIVPLLFQNATIKPSPGLHLRTALETAGRDVYIHEGCYNCHSQQVRNLAEEVLRYGPAAQAGESVWDHPFQWGSKRTGPDLSRVGGRYSDTWHRIHLDNPRDVVPESNMPGYPWLAKQSFAPGEVGAMMKVLKLEGVPYSDADIAGADAEVAGKTKMDALIAFLQSLKAVQAPKTADAAAQAKEKQS